MCCCFFRPKKNDGHALLTADRWPVGPFHSDSLHLLRTHSLLSKQQVNTLCSFLLLFWENFRIFFFYFLLVKKWMQRCRFCLFNFEKLILTKLSRKLTKTWLLTTTQLARFLQISANFTTIST